MHCFGESPANCPDFIESCLLPVVVIQPRVYYITYCNRYLRTFQTQLHRNRLPLRTPTQSHKKEHPQPNTYRNKVPILREQPPPLKMEGPDTFHQLALTIDPSTKAISTPTSSTTLRDELAALNTLHRSLLKDVEAPHTAPPPPVPVNPKRSAAITKLRESGNASFKKGSFADAVRMYGLAIEMALQRPLWEPAGLVREELAALYANRAQAYMALREWVEGAGDAEKGVELKKVGNVKGWWRRGVCLREMGRLEEAREWVGEGVSFESQGPDKAGVEELVALGREIEAAIERRRGA
ncbi:hypothetical protein M8818_005369 [Zalaria obscura]|uniref:Uncharacterized protein n=1 Tax=Zalaria obscura TaxID=2024903 RepID=A0ACC3S9Q0_9PEZI